MYINVKEVGCSLSEFCSRSGLKETSVSPFDFMLVVGEVENILSHRTKEIRFTRVMFEREVLTVQYTFNKHCI